MVPGGRLTPTNSPLRQSGRRTPPHLPPQMFSAPPVLPPILGSPTKLGLGLGQDNPAGDICGNTTLTAPHRAITLPEMTSVSRDPFTGQYGYALTFFIYFVNFLVCFNFA